jgi:nucleoside-diphosphate-sugar epimerase
VRALVRSRQRAAVQFDDLPVTLVEGDLARGTPLAPAMAGVDVLFHAAAHFREGLSGRRHERAMQAVNVEGTAAVLAAAADAAVPRVVHVSSIAVLDGPRGARIDASMRRPVRDADPYARSKLAADALVERFLAERNDRWAAIVLPGWMHGPGDLGPTAAARTIIDFAQGRIPLAVPGTVAVVDARDVALAALRAAERGSRGGRYLMAGPHYDMRDYLATLAGATGRPAPRFTAPLPSLYAAAVAGEAWRALSGRSVRLGLAEVRRLARDAERTRFDHALTARDLGVTFRPLDETLRDSVAWLRSHGML